MVTKKYSEIASELPAVLNVLQLFDGYMQVPHISHLTQRVHKLKEKLSVQVSADLQSAFQVRLKFCISFKFSMAKQALKFRICAKWWLFWVEK